MILFWTKSLSNFQLILHLNRFPPEQPKLTMAPRSDPNEKAISKPELNDEQENDEDDEAIDEVGEELSAVDLAGEH